MNLSEPNSGRGGRDTSKTPALGMGKKAKRPRRLFVVAGILFIAGIWLFRAPLQERIRDRAILANDAPPPEVVAAMIEQSRDPGAALLAAWKSGKIVHREVAIRHLGKVFPREQPLPREFDSMLLSAALDPDLNVRESALSILRHRRHPALAALAAEQLRDIDLVHRLPD